MKTAFIINPFSAKKNYQSFLDDLLAHEPNALYLLSKSIEETSEFIKRHLDSVQVFIAVGGDGTISTVAKELIGSDKVLGIFPAGSGNGFSNETNFNKNIADLLQKIANGKYKKIDTFTVNGNISINVAGVGLDGQVIESFEKTKRGFFNYIQITIRTFFRFKPIEVRFEEAWEQLNGSYMLVSVANTRQFGNNAYIAPQADHADGKLEIALVRKFPLWHAPIFAYRMFTKNLKENKYLTYISVKQLNFEVENSNAWHLDGEGMQILSPIEIRINPGSLNILTE